MSKDVLSQEGPRSVGISVPLKQDVQHIAVLVDHLSEPMSNAINSGADLVHQPAGTPLGFPLAQVIREQRTEFDTSYGFRKVLLS